MNRPKRAHLAFLLACIPLLVSGCGRTQTVISAPSEPSRSATQEAVSSQSLVPKGALELDRASVDLDNDGRTEEVVAYQVEQRLEVAVSSRGDARPWRGTLLPTGARFVSLRTQDMNADQLPEMLVDSSGPEEQMFNLTLIRWMDGHGHIMVPRGGPLDGAHCFRSQHYPPWIEDLNGDRYPEIVVSRDGNSPPFLDSLVYEWDDDAYSDSGIYIVPPRLAPSATPS